MSEQEKKIATRLKLLRIEAGLTQKDVAELLGVSQQTYSNMEKATSKLDQEQIEKLCNHYGISSDYLLCRESPKKLDTISQSMSFEDKQKLIAKITEEVLGQINTKS